MRYSGETLPLLSVARDHLIIEPGVDQRSGLFSTLLTLLMRTRDSPASLLLISTVFVYEYELIKLYQIQIVVQGERKNMFHKSAQTQFTGRPPVAGHYLNKHTKERLKKRKLDEQICLRDATTLTYNLLYMPRILKTDLRRQYPVMFMNVFNSCNYDYMQGFVNRFLRDDTTFILEAPSKLTI